MAQRHWCCVEQVVFTFLNHLIEFVSILVSQNRNENLETVKKSLQIKVDALSIFTVENLYTIFENKKEIIYKDCISKAFKNLKAFFIYLLPEYLILLSSLATRWQVFHR